jgi:hypothetical protein
MAGAPRLSTVDPILKGLRKSKRELCRLADALPDEDAYATAYSVIIDGINALDELIRDIKPAIKDAKEHRKQNPNQFPNRARKWCFIYDSNRKPSTGTEDAEDSNEETP